MDFETNRIFKTMEQRKNWEKNQIKVPSLRVKVKDAETAENFFEILFEFIENKRKQKTVIKVLNFGENLSEKKFKEFLFFVQNRNDTLLRVTFSYYFSNFELENCLKENSDPLRSRSRLLSPVGWSVDQHHLYSPIFKKSCLTFVFCLKYLSLKIPKFLIIKIFSSF